MSIVTVRTTTRWPPNPTSPVIAHLSGSKRFSHTMNIIEGKAYEATMLHGCRIVDLDEAMHGVAFYRDMFVEVPNVLAAIEFGEAQDGKDYDFAGAFGIPFLMSEDWADWSKWWCSEHNFAQIGAGGNWILDPNERKRVTPHDLFQCNYPKSEILRYEG